MRLLAECGRFVPAAPATCEACGRRIKCVYTVNDGGWTFLLGRVCYERLVGFMGAA